MKNRWIWVVAVLVMLGGVVGCSPEDPAYVELVGGGYQEPMYVVISSGGLEVAFAHDLGGEYHLVCTLAELSALISDGTIVGLAQTQELDNKTLDSSVAKGTWTASGIWTLPTFKLGGDVNADGKNHYVSGAKDFLITATDSFRGIRFNHTSDGHGGRFIIDQQSLSPANGDILWETEVFGRNDNAQAVSYALAPRYFIESNVDGSEGCRMEWKLISGGVMHTVMTLSSIGVLAVDDSYDTFDELDDAELLRKGISEGDKALMLEVGVLVEKRDIDGKVIEGEYMINLQNLMALLAGGVYQNRDYIELLEARIEALEARLGVSK